MLRTSPRILALVLALASSTASANPPGLTDTLPAPSHGRDTDRVQVGAGPVMYASYPMSIEDPAPAAFIAKPLWLGTRYRYFQWAIDANAVVGFGTASKSLHVSVAPQLGMNLYLGGVFGFELRMGPAGILQLGRDTVGGIGMTSSGGYVFRFWDDDRKRLKLLVHMQAGGYLADDPGNDLGTNAMAIGMGLAYERPL